MSYKNDSYLVISNKFGKASGDATAQLFETYDRLRDITISGQSNDGAGFGTAGSFLWKLASMISPSSFMSAMGGGTSLNIPGTSYWSTSVNQSGTTSAFGIGSMSQYSGFPSGAAGLTFTSNSGEMGYLTGGASSLTAASNIAGSAGISAAAYGAGIASGLGFGDSFLLPAAGVVSGIGGVIQAMSPYLGSFGLGATLIGNLLQGTGSAPLAAYQTVTNNILANADAILTNKVKNIETVVKMLDAQNDVVKKMLKDSIEGDSKAIQNL